MKLTFNVCTALFWGLLIAYLVIVLIKWRESFRISYIALFLILNCIVGTVLGMYCFVYIGMFRTLRALAATVQTVSTPNQEKKKVAPQELQLSSQSSLKEMRKQSSFRKIEVSGNTLRTKSMRSVTMTSMQRPDRSELVSALSEEVDEVITIEVPWDKIRFRFHLFFSGSIFLLATSFVFNVVVHLLHYLRASSLQYSILSQVFFATYTVCTATGMLLYIALFEDSVN